jgi:hypothetical protein
LIYQDIKDYADSNITSAMDIPYFEDDFWPKIIEDSLEKFETVNTSDSVNLDDSIEPEKPTKVRQTKVNSFYNVYISIIEL